jgi:putative two-component system hydrogenase maturation factor HypX/HoxX
MGSAACRDLLTAYRAALASPARVIVLTGGADFWSNGMDLNLIEAADSPAEESWVNINAIDDVAEAIISTTDRLVIAALQGNAGAGGVFLARAADEIWCHDGVVLSPHYKDMGNLFGSEFWTYLLPRRVGDAESRRIMATRLPIGCAEARRIGLVDRLLPGDRTAFQAALHREALALAQAPDLAERLAAKSRQRAADEQAKPLSAYRTEELAGMHTNFFGFDQSYHVARCNFVTKVPKSRTPVTLARHRQIARSARMAS